MQRITDNHHHAAMEDVQGRVDHRHLPIDRVGITGLRLPLPVHLGQKPQTSIATCALSVQLPEDRKGTHMSRMVALLHEQREVSLASIDALLTETFTRLDTQAAEIELQFTYFVEKTAPVSQARSLMDYEVTLNAVRELSTGTRIRLSVDVPVTSLCPCSKKISDYGAHNQRSLIRLTVEPADAINIETLIQIAESEASAELYAILKRPDEKFVTERAYDNPKFVEDLIRDVARRLDAEPSVLAFTVRVENFESIHNHSAVATLSHHKSRP